MERRVCVCAAGLGVPKACPVPYASLESSSGVKARLAAAVSDEPDGVVCWRRNIATIGRLTLLKVAARSRFKAERRVTVAGMAGNRGVGSCCDSRAIVMRRPPVLLTVVKLRPPVLGGAGARSL